MTEEQQQSYRLQALIDSLGLKQISFAARIKVTRGYISSILSGNKEISKNVIMKIAESFPMVNMNWLLNGIGDMFMPLVHEQKTIELQPGVFSQVMEPENSYDVLVSSSVLDSLVERISIMEDVIKEMLNEMEEMDKRLTEAEKCKK